MHVSKRIFFLFIRMFSTLKQKWREGVCQVRPRHRSGLRHRTGSVTSVFLIHVRYLAECGTDLDSPFLSQVLSWKCKLPLQTIMRLLQVLVPQVEKICIDKYVNTSMSLAGILNSVFDRLFFLFKKKRSIKETGT